MPNITPGLVGDWKVEVAAYDGGTAPTAWTRLWGITEFTPPQVEKNYEDDSEFDGSPWGSQIATSLSWTAEATVKTERAGMSPDPGQVILTPSGRGVLEQGFVHVRFIKNGATTGEEGIADIQWADNGGPKSDQTTAAVTMTGRGALTEYTPAP